MSIAAARSSQRGDVRQKKETSWIFATDSGAELALGRVLPTSVAEVTTARNMSVRDHKSEDPNIQTNAGLTIVD